MTPDTIYNIGIVAHVDAGKTTLSEQFLYLSGALREAGSVDKGNTLTDWLSVERERGISVRAAGTVFSWKERQINLIDTPGHVDFAAEVERSLSVIDGAILILSAVEGIQSHTENLWRALVRKHIPTLLFINKTDRAGSRYAELVSELSTLPESDGRTFLPCSLVEKEGFPDCTISQPPDFWEKVMEAAADYDDRIAEACLNGEQPEEAELKKILRRLVGEMRILPVFAGCAQKGAGVCELLDGVTDLLPNAGQKLMDGLCARIFKIEHDKTMGKIAHVRLYGGELHTRDRIRTPGMPSSVPEEKIAQIRRFNGQKYEDIGSVGAGDIAALCGLKSVRVLECIGREREEDSFHLANPFLSVRVMPEDETQLMPLLHALRELSDEDPLLNCQWEQTEREILIACTGKVQLEVTEALLESRYGLKASFSEPTVIYKETPSKTGEGFEAYTMPKPCWAIVRLRLEPLARGAGVQYDGGRVPHDTCFYKYQEHIRRSFFENLGQGPLGWEVTDLKATLVYAEHHTIHTHPLDFFVATPMALMDGLSRTGTTLLEPFIRVRITADEAYMGKIVGDLVQMRGEFDTPRVRKDSFTVEASLPVATSLNYPVRLASLTHGKGLFFSSFEGYRECPPGLGKTAKRRGINPLDRSKWILYARNALSEEKG